ncbi:unnamed protein product, partial [Hapterophycus canaliculatus]
LLLANPNPAAVSRFRLGLVPAQGEFLSHSWRIESSFPWYHNVSRWFNVWSSGMWVCTATGSTASMKAAGGQEMAPDSSDLQYMVREHMVE